MAQFFLLEGQDLGVTRVRLGSQDGYISAAESGTVATSGIQIDDPDGVLDIRGWQPLVINESLCTSHPSIFRGYIAAKSVRRSESVDESLRLGSARVWDCDLVDLNSLFYWRVIHLKEGKRPAETDIERMDWILGSQWLPSGSIRDNGLVDRTNPSNLDEADYRGQYAADVLDDCVKARFGKNYYAYWDEALGVSLFYGAVDGTTQTSTLRISNVATDVGDTSDLATTTYGPMLTPRLARDPSGVDSGVYLQYNNGAILRSNAATASNFLTRQVTVRNDRISRFSTAESIAAQLLAQMATEEDRIFVSVRLPASKVNLIREGMRIECKFSHLPDYEAFTFLRVARRTVKQTFQSEAFYDLDLELLPALLPGSGGGPGTPPGGGGGSGPGPYVPPPDPDCTPTIVQMGTVADPSVLPAPPTPGNTLVLIAGYRTPQDINTLLWTIEATADDPVDSHVDYAAIATRVVQSGDGTSWDMGSQPVGRVIELDGAVVADTAILEGTAYADPTEYGGPVTVTRNALVIGLVSYRIFDGDPITVVADGSQTTLVNTAGGAGFDVHPQVHASYLSVAAGTHTLSASPSGTSGGNPGDPHSAGITIAFTCAGAVDEDGAPGPGQETCEEFTGDGCVDEFTLNHPYLENSLNVKVGGVPVAIGSNLQLDPPHGIWQTPFVVGDGVPIIACYQSGAGPATGSNNPQPSSTTMVPAPLLGSGAEGQGVLVLHDDNTWGPITNADARGIFRTTYDGGGDLVATGSNGVLDLSAGNVQHQILYGDTTISFAFVPDVEGRESDITLFVRQSGTGPWGLSWPANVSWFGGSPPELATASNSYTPIGLMTIDQGETWMGFTTGGGVTEDEVQDVGRWEPVTNGDPINPEIVFDAGGDVVMEWEPG